MLIGILVPSGGRVRVEGRDPSLDRVEVARCIGVVFGQRTQLSWDLPLGDSFALLRHVYRVAAVDHRARLDELVELLDMGSFLATPVRQLSLGQRMRGELAAALLHDPPILFLDEPTIGLDIVSKEAVRGFLARLNRERGTTVLLTTHDLVDVPGPPLQIPGTEVTRVDGPRQWLRFSRNGHTASSLLAAIAAQARVRDITVEEPAIEDIVHYIYHQNRTHRDPGDAPSA